MGLQTAKQHNSAITGESEFTPRIHGRYGAESVATDLVVLYPGSWHLKDLKDTRQDLIDQVQSAAAVPSDCKAMIIEAISKVPGKLLALDAHYMIADTGRSKKLIFTMTVSEL